ncbi:nucleic acid-binding, OB-fold protein [Artemisia annua]|uniref:Nucleic acid-binding, OB-fold protein n=1 Tax=Artemisia annua TaxID=35608 RepID=A0A2U1LIQ2_ARTAN|nr:nucleic acid-binding, OB-fold protein [Artemisia annua]
MKFKVMGRAVRVTLWGKLADQMVKMMSSHVGKYTIILTSMSARYYNGQLGISSSSSTLILDSDDIPAIVSFKAQIRYIEQDSDAEVEHCDPVLLDITDKEHVGKKKRRYIEEDSDTETPDGTAVHLDKIDTDDGN